LSKDIVLRGKMFSRALAWGKGKSFRVTNGIQIAVGHSNHLVLATSFYYDIAS